MTNHYFNKEQETLSHSQIETLQTERLKKIVHHVYDNNAWYKKSFDAAGVSPSSIKTLEDIAKLPTINKTGLPRNLPDGTFLRR